MPHKFLGQDEGLNKLSAFLDRLEASLEATNDSIKRPLTLKLGTPLTGTLKCHPRPHNNVLEKHK